MDLIDQVDLHKEHLHKENLYREIYTQRAPRQRASFLKRSTFQGFKQYPGNSRPCSLSNSRNNLRLRSCSRSRSRNDRFENFNQPFECYYCHRLGHTANNCYRCQNRNFPRGQTDQGMRNFNSRNQRRYTNYRGNDRNYRGNDTTYVNYRANDMRNRQIPDTSLRRVTFADSDVYLDLQSRNHQ